MFVVFYLSLPLPLYFEAEAEAEAEAEDLLKAIGTLFFVIW